jgi:Domain of unknown function (DUF4276)
LAKRLVIFVEGKGDVAAIPALAQRVVRRFDAHDALFVDHEPFRVRGVATLVKNNCFDWHRWLDAAGKTRRNLGAVLLVLDGDMKHVPNDWSAYRDRFRSTEFCAFHAAATLVEEAKAARAGDAYSVASVFAMKEFEAWLLAGVESLRGKHLANGRGVVPMDAVCPEIDVEQTRDAKGGLKRVIPIYNPSLDQGLLAREIDIDTVLQRCRSFGRFCSALQQLAQAVRSGQNVVTPAQP